MDTEEGHLVEIRGSILTVSWKDGYLHYQTDELRDGTRVLTIGVNVKDVHINMKGIELNVEISKKASCTLPPGDIYGAEIENIFFAHPFSKINKCESPLEAHFFIIASDDFPNLEPQFIVDHYRLDFAFPDEMIAIEIDGHEFHKTREQRTNDAKRERYLQSKGWKVIRFTGTEIFGDILNCIQELKGLINVFQNETDNWKYSTTKIMSF